MDINSFLSQEEKNECINLWSGAFNTFSEMITIYKTPDRTLVSSDPTQFNYYYGQSSVGQTIAYTPQSGNFAATVEYIDSRLAERLGFNPKESPAKSYEGVIRITVGTDAKAFLDNLDKIVFDNINFRIWSDITYRGMFGPRTQFDYFLRRIEP